MKTQQLSIPSQYPNTPITPITDYHSPGRNNLLHTHGIKQGTPIQGRQKAPPEEASRGEETATPFALSAAQALLLLLHPRIQRFQDRPRSFLSRWFCHFAARKERALTRADHKTRRNRAISRDPADKPALRPCHEACPSFLPSPHAKLPTVFPRNATSLPGLNVFRNRALESRGDSIRFPFFLLSLFALLANGGRSFFFLRVKRAERV